MDDTLRAAFSVFGGGRQVYPQQPADTVDVGATEAYDVIPRVTAAGQDVAERGRRGISGSSGRTYSADMSTVARRLLKGAASVMALLCLLLVLAMLEATGGHDGWLCGWGIDTDGAGTGTTGCR